jgi:hypothetical protein
MNIDGSIPASLSPLRMPVPPLRPQPEAKAAEGARPSAAESSLWNSLTAEEKEFFVQAANLGPVTYRPGCLRRDDPAAPVGQRVDVRG